mgnify:CR=1 FL=1
MEKQTLNDYLEMLMEAPFTGHSIFIYDEDGNVIFTDSSPEKIYDVCSHYLLKCFVIKKKTQKHKKHTLVVEITV